MSFCTVDECDRTHRAKGLCSRHYFQDYRKGNVEPRSSGLPAKVPTTIVDFKPAPSEPGILHPHDRSWMRKLWLAVQGYECAVCGGLDVADEHGRGGVYGFWRLSVDGSCCRPSRMCCVRGTVCYKCNRPVTVYSKDNLLTPSHLINDLTIHEWTARADAFLAFDSDRSDHGDTVFRHHSQDGQQA